MGGVPSKGYLFNNYNCDLCEHPNNDQKCNSTLHGQLLMYPQGNPMIDVMQFNHPSANLCVLPKAIWNLNQLFKPLNKI
jgi:hypothetical protein